MGELNLTHNQIMRDLKRLRQENSKFQKEVNERKQNEESLKYKVAEWLSFYKQYPISTLIFRRTDHGYILENFNNRTDEAMNVFTDHLFVIKPKRYIRIDPM